MQTYKNDFSSRWLLSGWGANIFIKSQADEHSHSLLAARASAMQELAKHHTSEDFLLGRRQRQGFRTGPCNERSSVQAHKVH